LKEHNDVTDLRHAKGALNLKARLPLFLKMFGTVKERYSVCLNLNL